MLEVEMTDIPGYEGKYAITRDGRVWSYPKRRRNGRIEHNGLWMKLSKKGNGYYKVGLRVNGEYKPKTFNVHRLVAHIYVPNPCSLPQVNHKNGNKSDNRAENLEWTTAKGNIAHATVNNLLSDRVGENNGASKLTLIQAINILHCRGAISGGKLAKLYSVSEMTVYGIWSGKLWKGAIDDTIKNSPLQAKS